MTEFTKISVSHETALCMAKAAMAKAKELNFAISVCIVDESGIMKFFTRMDNAPLISVDAARKKAVTAAGFGLPTGKPWFDFIKDDPILREGVHGFTDFMLMGGGHPLTLNEKVIGAIGVSGGHYENDELCAQAALSCLQK
ncbi:MAG: heme-binding protein [Bacteroidota bacterium]